MSSSQVPPSPQPTPPPQPFSMKLRDPNAAPGAAPGAAAVTPAPVSVGTPVAEGGVGAPLPPKLRRDMVGHSRSRGHGEFAV